MRNVFAMLTVFAVLAVVVGFVGCSPKTESSLSFGSESSFLTGNVPAVEAARPDSCSDSDGGKNYYRWGTASGYARGTRYGASDSCKSATILLEQWCDGNKRGAHHEFDCSTVGKVCGALTRNPRVKGCVGPPTPSPVCGNNVKEGPEECDDGNIANGDGCSSTCLLQCVDTDGGKNYVSAGRVIGYNVTYDTTGAHFFLINQSDGCIGAGTVSEGFCSGNLADLTTAICPKGCTAGACNTVN